MQINRHHLAVSLCSAAISNYTTPLLPLQVRFSWMLPMRLLMLIGYAKMYQTVGKAHPWLEAAIVNFGALAVTKVMESRMRKLYRCCQKRMSKAEQAQTNQQLKAE